MLFRSEKPGGDGAWINGGFFVLSPRCLGLIDGDATSWEKEPVSAMAAAGELKAFEHRGFWHAMDTLRDKQAREGQWATGKAPWMAKFTRI